ncbi:MAG TPA: hypothetical protein VG817_11500 [Gemmatimonadales bacterium]|nr:hypothetical protein [Gemmatimonadales bacterium]
MPSYRWKCTRCGIESPPVPLAAEQRPPVDELDRNCPICQETTVHQAAEQIPPY